MVELKASWQMVRGGISCLGYFDMPIAKGGAGIQPFPPESCRELSNASCFPGLCLMTAGSELPYGCQDDLAF
jgi:hypothetical protein